jgi:hypothetical protein
MGFKLEPGKFHQEENNSLMMYGNSKDLNGSNRGI